MSNLLVVWMTVLFVALKLTGHVDWSWLWVLSPLWVYLIVFLIMLLVVVGVALATDETLRLKRRK